jgi:S1-C subfamily serine protease
MVSFSSAEISNQTLLTKIRDNTVSIFMEIDTGGAGYCTGVVIKNDVTESAILTAKHCTENNRTFYVEDLNSQDYAVDLKNDLAIIYFDSYISNKNTVKLSINNNNVGDLVFHLGYPTSGELFSMAEITKITLKNAYATFRSIPGCSGGGVFNASGELVGILWGGVGEDSVFEPIKDIRNFLSQIGINQ